MPRFPLALMAVSAACALNLQAAPMTFFGEDTTGNATTRATNVNAAFARTSFLGFLPGSSTDNLESLAAGTPTPIPLTFSGISSTTVTGGNAFVRSLASGTDGFGEYPTSGSKYIASDPQAALTITFSSAVTSFGFYATDVGDFSNGSQLSVSFLGASGTIREAVNNTTSTGRNSAADGSLLFYGYINAAAPFTSVQILSPSDNFAFDDPVIGIPVTTATPEPATVFLIAAGLVAVSARRLQRL